MIRFAKTNQHNNHMLFKYDTNAMPGSMYSNLPDFETILLHGFIWQVLTSLGVYILLKR